MVITKKSIVSKCVAFFLILTMFGCASPYHVKKIPDFNHRIESVKTIGLLEPIEFGSNKENTGSFLLHDAIVNRIEKSASFTLKRISQENYQTNWDSDLQRVYKDSRELLKEIELEKIWRDKKNELIERKFQEDIKIFKTLDPELDALLLLKVEQHYDNPWAAGLYAFGALGGLIAASTAERDPVIGSHAVGVDDIYSSSILVDLATSDVLWYNFSYCNGLNIENKKHADLFAGYMLQGLIKE